MLIALLVVNVFALMFLIAILSQVASMNSYIAASFNWEYTDEVEALREMQEANQVPVSDEG